MYDLPLYQVALWLAAWLSSCLTISRPCAFLAPHHRTVPYRTAHTQLCELSARELAPIRAVGGPAADVYGELSSQGFRTLAKRIGLSPSDAFLDVGSGHGKLVLQAGNFGVASSTGIEMSPSRHSAALRALAASPRHIRRRASMVCGDVSSTGDGLDDAVGSATAVYVSNLMFSAELTSRIAQRLEAVVSVRVIAVLVPFAHGSLAGFVADQSPEMCEMSWAVSGERTGVTIYRRAMPESTPDEARVKPSVTPSVKLRPASRTAHVRSSWRGVRRHAAVHCSALTPVPDSNFAVREAGEGRGLGLFTTVPIEESTFLFDYVGLVLPAQEYVERFSGLSEYILAIDNAYGYTFIIDAQDPEVSNLARYMNHAKMGLPSLPRLGLVASGPCNCLMLSESSETYAKFVEAALDTCMPEQMPPPRLHVFTLRAIAAGEELCWDYGEEYWTMMAKRGIFQAAVE